MLHQRSLNRRIAAAVDRHPLPILVGCALLIQVFGRYHAHHFTVGPFYYSWIILRILLPICLLLLLKVPLSRLALERPCRDRFLTAVAALSLLALGGIYFVIRFSPEYGAYYADRFGPADRRLLRFMIFTLSTLTGWEFFHRGFLLQGLRFFLEKKHALSASTAAGTALAFVWVFEVLFHLIKPGMEALGMWLASPLLCLITIRSGSIWPAFVIHLAVEAVFILSI